MSAESNRRLEQGGRSRVRSNLCEVEKARRRNMEQSMSGAKAKRRDQQLGLPHAMLIFSRHVMQAIALKYPQVLCGMPSHPCPK